MAQYSVSVNKKWCKNCGICVAYCPKQVFALTNKRRLVIEKEAACIGCKMCAYRCPDLAITIAGKGE